MTNVTIKIKGAMAHQNAEVKNVYIYVDGRQVDRYITRNVKRLLNELQEELGFFQVDVED